MHAYVKISAIIPVFNGAVYLKECLDSILAQSLTQVEILIIDDGSTDGTWELIQAYSVRYDFIHGFQQERKRQGAARNIGLEHATGEFISFVDADDLLPHEAYSSMYALAQESESDLVTGIKKSISARKRGFLKREASWITIPEHKKYFTQTMADIQLEDIPELLVDISVCNKLIRRSFIDLHNFRFIENSAGEDIDFMSRLYLAAEHISVIPKVIYHYCSRPNSRTSRIQSGFFYDRVSVTLKLEAAFRERDLSRLFPLLVLSESRKLVGNRLTRVVTNLPYDDQISVFKIIGRLVGKLTAAEITEPRIDLSDLAASRLLMLFYEEFEALIAFTNVPEGIRYISLIEKNEAKARLLAPLLLLAKPSVSKSIHLRNVLSDIRRAVLSAFLLFRKYAFKLFSSSGRKAAGYLYFLILSFYHIVFSDAKADRNIWLIDERVSKSAEDNSYFLFEYLRTNHPELEVYYVIEKSSPHRAKVEELGNVVCLYSFKHASLLNRAKVLLSTDRFTSLAYPYNIFPRLRRKTHNVFLQHGVAGNKTMTYTRKNYPYFSQVIVSNDIERRFFVRDYHFSEESVTVTGIARFDKLSPTLSKTRSNKILIAPTWRKWLRDSNIVGSSEYLAAWNQLMTHPRLAKLARKHDVKIYFRPHFNMMKFIDRFHTDSKHIYILTERDLYLQPYIKECQLLITDYSSVMYDFFFQEKPTVCYMFDRRQWELQPPGPPHLDFDNDLAADIASNPKQVIDLLAGYFENDFQMPKKYSSRIDDLITYRDNNNCKRIIESVINKVSN